MKKPTIRPFDFVKLKNGNYFWVFFVKNRMTELGESPDKIIQGVCFESPIYSGRLEKYFGISGKSTNDFINMKTATCNQIQKFIYHTGHNLCQSTDGKSWDYLDEVVQVINRKQESYALNDNIEVI